MPFLRVIRDKRGYETSYLMHWFQEGGRARSRVLYAFRGPGGTRVGRAPLEADTMSALERQFPEIEFDWKAVYADRQVIEPSPEIRRRRPKRDDDEPAVPEEKAAPAVRDVKKEPAASPTRQPSIPTVIAGETVEQRVAFLASWYPIVRERVERRTTDELRRQALSTLAERLNTEGWAGVEDTEDKLQQAAEALERLGRVLTRRRRRGGKSRGAAPAATPE